MQLWSGLPLVTLFEHGKVESLNNNLVAFEMVVENLERALKSAQYSTECVCKVGFAPSAHLAPLTCAFPQLAKKDGHTYLTFIIEIQTTQVMNVIQDVPIRLLSPSQLALLSEPEMPNPTVHIMLPTLKNLKPIVDRLKGLSDWLALECNMDGILKLGVTTDSAKITTVITGLDHPKVDGDNEPPRDADLWGSARVDMKKFSRFLGAVNVSPDHVVCCIIVQKAVVMHAILDSLYLTYYLPVSAQ